MICRRLHICTILTRNETKVTSAFPAIFSAVTDSFAQVGYTHIELQGGYESFPNMSNKSGISLNMGARYAFDERYFAAVLLHCDINNGSYDVFPLFSFANLVHTTI